MNSSFPEEIQTLAALFLFRNVSIEELEHRIPFLASCIRLEFADGEIIQSAGAPLHAIAVLTRGSAVICAGAYDSAVILRRLGVGDVCGALSLYCDDGGYETIIRAEGECALLLLPGDTVKHLISADPLIAQNYIRFLSERICFLNRKITAFTAGSAEAKLAAYLLSLPPCADGTLCLPCSMSELSDSLNMSRASLYRAWDTLIHRRILSRDGKKVTVEDWNALNTIIQE